MELPFPAWNSAFDGLYPHGDQWYWRGDYVKEIPDAAIEAHVEFAKKLPTWKSTMHLYPSDGAASRVAERCHRMELPQLALGLRAVQRLARHGRRAGDARLGGRRLGSAPPVLDGRRRYVNFMMEEGQERVQATYGSNYERLARVKGQYDPDNVFHVNQNIKPAA